MQTPLPRPARSRQRGVTLVVVLLILVVVTILGIGGAQIALLGERSTRYDRDYLIASQAAEAALMDAEFDIRGPNTDAESRVALFTADNTGIFVPDCSNNPATRGLCEPKPESVKPVWASVDFMDEDAATARTVGFGEFTGRAFDAGSAGVKPARAPRYVIEVLPDVAGRNSAKYDPSKAPDIMYRITSLGFGPREETQVAMQITFRKERE
jgi:type IV pilus assembly protein PilX